MNCNRQNNADPASPAAKLELLSTIYEVYDEWAQQFPLACRKGCAACCTQSVTMTGLEGSVILEFAARTRGQQWLLEKLCKTAAGQSTALITTNQFAEACLNQREVAEESLEGWNFSPCVFLQDNICSIYEVRPFGCRSFASLVRCTADRAAEITPLHLAVNTAFLQVIEHIDSDGGSWSTMTDILHSLADSKTLHGQPHLLPARPVPGFLLDSHEVRTLRPLLKKIETIAPVKGIIGDLIDNFMPI